MAVSRGEVTQTPPPQTLFFAPWKSTKQNDNGRPTLSRRRSPLARGPVCHPRRPVAARVGLGAAGPVFQHPLGVETWQKEQEAATGTREEGAATGRDVDGDIATGKVRGHEGVS